MKTKHIDSLGTPEALLLSMPERETESVPRKITPEEYYSSPEFQRRLKIENERREREVFKKSVAFRAAQAQNPIKGKPRRKRSRKFRSR